MTKQSNTREDRGKDEKNSGDREADKKGKGTERNNEKTPSEKRTQRITLKPSSAKPASRITLRTKAKQEETGKTPVKASTLRSPTKARSSTPIRSPHTTVRAGKAPALSSHVPRAARTQTVKSNGHRSAANDENRAQTPTTTHIEKQNPPHYRESSNSSFSRYREIEHERAEFESLGEPSQVTGPNSFLVKLLPEATFSDNIQSDWELVGYPKPIDPTPVSITPVDISTKVHRSANPIKLNNRQTAIVVEDTSSPSDIETTAEDAQPTKASSSLSSGKYKESALLQDQERSNEYFESKIRSILNQHNQAHNRRANKSHDSLKSVKWDPSIVLLGPKTSTPSSTTKSKGSGATGAKKSLEDNLKDLKKGDRRVLAQLLEALRDIESDDDSSTGKADQEDILGAKKSLPNQVATSEENLFSKRPTRNDKAPKPVACNDQNSYNDPLAPALIQSAEAAQRTNHTGENSSSSEQTLIGNDGTGHYSAVDIAPGFRTVKKLNPRAQAFGDFGLTKHRAAQSDPVEERYPIWANPRERKLSYDNGNMYKNELPIKVDKYIPPPLRGHRNLHSPDKEPLEPVWVNVRSAQSPGKQPQSGLYAPGRPEKPKMVDNCCPAAPKDLALNGEADQQNETTWLKQWILDAAKPDYGLGDYPAVTPPAIQINEPFNSHHKDIIEDLALSTQVHEDTTSYEHTTQEGPLLPSDWASINQNMMQYLNLLFEQYPVWPFPIAGPLIPVPPPLFQCQPFLHDPPLMQIPMPSALVDAPIAPKIRIANGEKTGRTACALDPAWADMVLSKFILRFPLTGKSQSNFPVPPVHDLDTEAAQIQQKLELLLFQQKEKKAFERRSTGMSSDKRSGVPAGSLSSSESECLIRFDSQHSGVPTGSLTSSKSECLIKFD